MRDPPLRRPMDASPDAAKEATEEDAGGDTAAAAAPATGELTAGNGVRRAEDPSSHRQTIRWDQFLPRRSLRVLLVEHDHSTRHIVAALLRKCSYHVAAVADEMKAWEVLKDKHYNFDLVLAEVDMPSLSGIGLLTKIVASEECKNVPVIMMSSEDSIGIVLKCMLKGAADFLVKPVRRNELRNLWQHVWRRHCMQSNYIGNATGNHAASNHSSANARVESKTGENSEKGDAQSSGSKPEIETENTEGHKKTPHAQAGSSSGQVKLEEELLENDSEFQGNKLKIDDETQARDESSMLAAEMNQSLEGPLLPQQSHDKNDSYKVRENGEEEPQYSKHKEHNDAEPFSCQRENAANDLAQDFTAENCSSSPLASPKRSQLRGSVNISVGLNHAWNHSDASAFSRYAGKRMLEHSYEKPVSSALYIGTSESFDMCCSRIGGSHGSFNAESGSSKEPLLSHQENAVGTAMYLQVPSDNNKENASRFASSSEREAACVAQPSNGVDFVYHHSQFCFIPLPIPVGAMPFQNAGYHSSLQPMFHPESSLHPQNSCALEKGMIPVVSDQSCDPENVINHQHIEYDQHKETHQSIHWGKQTDVEQKHPGEPPLASMKHPNESASFSQDIYKSYGSEGCNETIDTVANVGTTLESGNESGVQNYIRKELDQDRSRREAALIKFRLKRKDRCFEKKVRYHTRKMLAEQRPRVKGQFVRQKGSDPPPKTDVEDV